MKNFSVFLFLFCVCVGHAQQKVISLYNGKAPGSENWDWQEERSDSNSFHTPIVYNVSQPTLTVFMPDSVAANGTAVIICPGGAFQVLSIESEGFAVARWLNSKGVTAFVLKYRLSHSLTNDPIRELFAKQPNSDKFNEEIKPEVSFAIADGKAAIVYLRQHAAEYKIAPDRIGIIGFSAGGTVATGVAYTYDKESRPDFDAPIYPYVGSFAKTSPPRDAPPLFIAAAADDQFGFDRHCTALYNDWVQSKHVAELHVYARGGHGFGMRKQDLTSDTWIDRFGDWLNQLGLLSPAGSTALMATRVPPQMQEAKKKPVETYRYDWANIERFSADNKILEPVSANEKRIVFMGNSITEGWKRIDSGFFARKSYINRGISGQTTSQMLVRFREDVIDLNPAVVLILAGTNDIAGNTGPISLENIFGNIKSMAELAKENHIKVVLSSVLPAFDYPWKRGLHPAEKIFTLNKWIKDYAEKNGMVYLDYFSAMADEKKGMKASLGIDGVHPNLAGYKIMDPLAEKAIAEALKHK